MILGTDPKCACINEDEDGAEFTEFSSYIRSHKAPTLKAKSSATLHRSLPRVMEIYERLKHV